MFGLFENTEARRETTGRFPWPLIVALVAVALFSLTARSGVPNFKFNAPAPAEQTTELRQGTSAIQASTQQNTTQNVDPQPAQNIPEVAPLPKVHVEWTQVGVAHNGDEVVALGIPWDKLVYVPVDLIENLPPGGGVAGGLPTQRGTIILFALGQTAPWVYTYWKGSEIPISYAPEPWVYTLRGKLSP